MATALSLDVGESAYSALELLKQGRGIISGLQLETRSDITALEEQYPALAIEFRHLRQELDLPFLQEGPSQYFTLMLSAHEPNDTFQLDSKIHRRYVACTEFKNIIERIRGLSGFERFLLGPSEHQFKNLAETGPIVVFNIATSRSDAFLIKADGIEVMNLPDLNYTKVGQKADRFVESLNNFKLAAYPKMREQLQKDLKWLWRVAVGPILEGLGISGSPKGESVIDWPRVWWVGSGSLNTLPIHAAGDHSKGSDNNAIDRVISSYAPTVKALKYARERMLPSTFDSQKSVLIIGMPKTPKQAELVYVREEIDALSSQDILPNDIPRIILVTPLKAEVLRELPQCQIVHFACHGMSDLADPSRSCLLLQDWETDPLIVADITSLQVQNARLAYISACHAATTRVPGLFDEGIHLTGAFQLSGFPHVIGTLWQISDHGSVAIADTVYRLMVEGGILDIDKCAEGLHFAIRKLRDSTRIIEGFTREGPENPLIWAPYVHFGA